MYFRAVSDMEKNSKSDLSGFGLKSGVIMFLLKRFDQRINHS